jgi:hypothetical protein
MLIRCNYCPGYADWDASISRMTFAKVCRDCKESLEARLMGPIKFIKVDTNVRAN